MKNKIGILILFFLYGILIYRLATIKDNVVYTCCLERDLIIEENKDNIKTDFNSGYIEDIIVDIEEEANLIYLGQFKLTGYCDCYECQEEFVGTTALGVAPTANWTIAVDPNVIPLGSIVIIDGKEYRAEDTGGAINQNKIDMFMSSHSECYSDICNGYKDVYLKGAD